MSGSTKLTYAVANSALLRGPMSILHLQRLVRFFPLHNTSFSQSKQTPRTDMRIREWPIVLTCSLRYLCRPGEWLATHPFYSLDHLEGPEVMKMFDTQRDTLNTANDKRSDPPFFHERQGVGGEGAADLGVHDLGSSRLESIGSVAFGQAEVAVDDYADQRPGVETRVKPDSS
jgi:hypothetical protein